MKKFAIFALVLVMAASLCACACTNNDPATTPSNNSSPSTQIDRRPTDTMTIPMPETNVPDTGVDDSLPGGITGDMTDGTNGGTNGGTGRTNSPMGPMQ